MQTVNHSPPGKISRGLVRSRIATLVLIGAIFLLAPIPLLDTTAAAASAVLLAVMPVLLPANGFEFAAALLVACFLIMGLARPADGSLPRRTVVFMVATILVDVHIPILDASAAEAGLDLLGRMEGLIPQNGAEVAAAFALALLAVSVSPAFRGAPGKSDRGRRGF